MLVYPGFNPIAFEVGRIKVHWYGIMYLLGFAAAWWLARRRAARPVSTWKPQDVDDLIFFAMLGVIFGGRIGYVLFYGLSFWASDPWYPFKIWEGGMAFHGGLLGVAVALTLFAWRRRRNAAGSGPVLRPARQLHQRRAVGQGHHGAVGFPVPRPGAPSLAAVRGDA